MKLDLSLEFDKKKAIARFKKLLDEGAKIELKKVAKKRSLNQNSYFHVACGLLGDYAGYTVDEMKKIIKDQLEWMVYTKGNHTFYRSSADLNKEEFTKLVDYTRSFGDEHGVYIPTPEEYLNNAFEIERQLNHI